MLCFMARRLRSLIQPALFLALCVMLLALPSQHLVAQTGSGSSLAAPQGDPGFKALMLSDLHLDALYDPSKVKELASAPVGRWDEILSRPDSPTRAQDAEMLHKECGGGADPSPSLFASMTRAIRSDAGEVRFITVSGDFLPHKIDCIFPKIVPGASPRQYEDFTEKIIEYEVLHVHQALPDAPLYLALGNNDSNCRDDYFDTGSEWLRGLAKVAKLVVGPAWNKAATESIERGGYYSVPIAAPMGRTRIIVVNDLLMTGSFKNCAGKADTAAGEKQIEWLRSQLNDAQKHDERVWVLGHIPPGVSPSGLLRQGPPKGGDMCKPNDRSKSSKSSTAIDVFGDMLALFGHWHDDHMELLEGNGGAVPVKIVPALDRDRPAFTVAQVDPMTSELTDYTVISASDKRGLNWSKEYTFSEAYGQKGFRPDTLRSIIAKFGSDPSGTTRLSQEYLLHWSAGDESSRLRTQQIWPGFVCGMDHAHSVEYKQCVCRSSLGPLLGAASR